MTNAFRNIAAALGLAVMAATLPVAAETLMLEQPTVSADNIAFVYAGDIWVADRDGGNVRRLTTDPATETNPSLSPDGSMIAYTGNYNGNADVYVVATAGGQPKRLTWHPGADIARGWTPDGASILFMSGRAVMERRGEQLFTVSPDGDFPAALELPQAYDAAFSPDATHIAYQVYRPAQSGGSGWDRHRGGTTPPIWIFDRSTQEIVQIPHDRVNDIDPMWVGDMVYFLSDRADTVNLFGYDTTDGTLSQLTHNDVWDIESASATDGVIVFDAGGRIHELNLADGSVRTLSITVNADFPQLNAAWKDASRSVTNASLSPSGARAVFSARGDIFTVPAEKGNIRNLTNSNGANDRDALWSPKGDRIAWVTDESGRFQLVLADPTDGSEVERMALGDDVFYFLSNWSPDGDKILYQDNHLNLYLVDLASGDTRLVATNTYRSGFEAAFSPDGKWLAYSRSQPNYMRALVLYNVASGDSHDVTEGMADIGSPAFSRDGKYLYITASTNSGPRSVGLDMSTQERPLRRGIYAIVLAADGASPLPPESDDEDVSTDADDGDEKENRRGSGWGKSKSNGNSNGDEPSAETRIDLAGLTGRMVALPVAERDYDSLAVAKDGSLFYMERRQPGVTREPPGAERQAVHSLMRFDFEDREAKTFKAKVAGFSMSGDGSKLLALGPRQRWTITATKGNGKKGDGLNLSDMRVRIDPRAEWAHIFEDVWRAEQAYFYDPGMHGLDWQAVYDKYYPLLAHVARREDLNTLMVDMIAELEVGHNRVGGGDIHRSEPVRVGLLGADFEVANGSYRITRLLTGENWNAFDAAPLAVPGLGVSVGTYILAVNGQDLTGDDNIYSRFEQTVGKQVVLSVSDTPDAADGRDITVVPIANDRQLRLWAHVEANRKYVAEATDGRVGYIYLPNTGGGGFTYFNRYFFPQVDKEGLIVDERNNGGGQAANYITEVLGRPYLSSWRDRDGMVYTTPGGVMAGPKVMLINQYAGSGGDFLPWSFRYLGLGPLIGTRTWGGLIGISANPQLIDGGRLSVPFFRYFNPDGEWGIENVGVPPDIEVIQTPKDVIAGRDPQLDAGIAEVLKALEGYTSPVLKTAPPMPTEVGN